MGVPPQILQGIAIGAPIAGGIAQGRAAEAQAGAQAQAALYNAQIAQAEGDAEASRIRRAGRRELSRQRTILGASDVRAEGSPLEVLAQNAYEIERDAVNAQIAGRNTANLDRAQAASAKRAGRISSASALLGGAIQGVGTGLSLWNSQRLRRAGTE